MGKKRIIGNMSKKRKIWYEIFKNPKRKRLRSCSPYDVLSDPIWTAEDTVKGMGKRNKLQEPQGTSDGTGFASYNNENEVRFRTGMPLVLESSQPMNTSASRPTGCATNYPVSDFDARFDTSMPPGGEIPQPMNNGIPSRPQMVDEYEPNSFGSQISSKSKPFDKKDLDRLEECQTSELAISLGRDSDCLYLTINEIMRDSSPRCSILDLLLKLLSRVLYSDFTENVTAILETVHDSALLGPFIIYNYLRKIDNPSTHSDVRRSQQSLETVCRVLIGIYQYLPRSEIEKYWETETMLCGIISKLAVVHAESSIDKYTKPLMRRLALKSNPRSVLRESNSSSLSLLDSNHFEFMNDTILPTKENLAINPVLVPNKVKGSYTNVEEYLYIQFLLLKEDFLRPFRQGIQEFQKHQADNSKARFHSSGIKVFQNARIIETVCDNSGILYSIQFDVQRRHLNFLSRRFIYGSLVCFWNESKDILLFATVANRDDKKIQRGIIDVVFEGQSYFMVKHVSEGDSFHMIESSAYYESYRHVLQGIQQFAKAELNHERHRNESLPQNGLELECEQKNELENSPQPSNSAGTSTKENAVLVIKNEKLDKVSTLELEKFDQGRLPFQKYIVNVDHNTNPPKYLSSPYITYNLGTLLKKGMEKVDIFDSLAWPSAELLGLDEAQLEALRYTLTHELAIIQGPPGCGKTFLGLKIVDVLLHNQQKWLDPFEHSPILVVCYTNHALDQFLNGVLTLKPFKGNGIDPIVRVGSRCKDEALQPYILKSLKRHLKRKNDGYFRVRDCKEEIERYKYHFKESFQGIVSLQHIVYILNRLSSSEIEQIACTQMNQLLPEENQFPYRILIEEIEIESSERRLLDWLCPDLLRYDKTWCEKPRENQNVSSDVPDDLFFDRTDADYEYTQRMIDEDFEEFEDFEHSSSLIDKKKISKFHHEVIQHICQQQPITNQEIYQIGNIDIWHLDFKKRWGLYQGWIWMYRKKIQEILRRLYLKFQAATRMHKEATLLAEEGIFRRAQVLGMTTTTAAKYRSVLQRVAPKIVIIEEAAEVLEGHVITSLSAGCQHLILIGDHQQLRPKPTTYELEKNFNLGISLFERLIKNDIAYKKLETQHRMRPIISSLLVPHFYPKLKNGSEVYQYEDIKGVNENMFFLDHSVEEDKLEFGTSHSNEHEARFLVSFAFYLQHQGYKASEITIVTAYHAQATLVRKIFKLEAEKMPIKRKYGGPYDIDNVHVTPIDNYQGEENEIILLSLVRSNEEKKLGFMNEWNRICVALSRAKKGFYAMGNFSMAEKNNKKWKIIISDIKKMGKDDHCYIGRSLALKCCNHGDKPYLTKVATAKDFDEIIDGSCNQRCGVQMDCGHVCRRKCHSDDNNHIWGQSKCQQICNKLCPNDHPCKRRCQECSNGCRPCQALVTKFLTKCKHEQEVECHIPEIRVTCMKPCEKKLDCGHKCQNVCGVMCTFFCQENINVKLKCGHIKTIKCHEKLEEITCRASVNITLPCKHKCETKCFIGEDAKCMESCNTTLKCGHKCKGTCGSCHSGRLHEACKEMCKRILVCGHECPSTCSESCPPCERPCEKGCSHAKCPKRCGDPCIPCREPCIMGCKHRKCMKMCFEKCDIPPCNKKCSRVVTFSCCKKEHDCIGLCGEPHPKCPNCKAEEIREIFFGTEDEKDACFIQLENCKHIFEVTGLDKWMTLGNNERDESIQFKKCPKCQTTITDCKRYANDIKTMNNDIIDIKQKITNWNKYKEKDLTEFKKELRNDAKLPRNMKAKICVNLEKQMQRVKTSNTLVVVRNQYNFAVHVSKLMKKIEDFFSNQDSKCQKMLTELRNIATWVTKERRTFSDQETREIRAELERLRLKTDFVLLEKTLQDREVTLEDEIAKDWEKVSEMLYSIEPLSTEMEMFVGDILKTVKEKHIVGGLGISDDERLMILEAMNFRQKGHWYKCPNGHLYAIGECGGATVESTCPECKATIGGASHRLRSDNAVASEMDGATHSAWSEQANLANYEGLGLF